MISARRVAHVTTAHPHTDNRIFRKECAALVSAGFDVYLVAVAPNDQQQQGVNVYPLPYRRRRVQRILLGPVDAWRALRHLDPAMIHVHDPELILLAIVWRALHSRPAVYDAHEDLAKQVAGKTYVPRTLRPPLAWLARRLEGAADAYLSAIVAATPSIRRNFHRAPVTLVQNFPWLRDFRNPTDPDPNLHLTLSYVGGITRERGCLEMVEAVRRSPTSPHLVLAGPASSEMASVLRTDSSGLIDFRGVRAAEEVPEIIARSHAGLVLLHSLPNYLESQPTKLFEYMAAGRPFIASHFPYWKELLEEFDCGVFIDPLDIVALTETIEWLGQNPEAATAKGKRGRRILETHFTFENEAQRLVSLTHRLLDA